MVMRPETSLDAAKSSVSDFEAAILKQSGLVVKVELVERYAEALAALCAVSGQASVAWLNGPAYVAARAENCGTPVLQVERGSGDKSATGETGIVIVTKGKNIANLTALKGRIFCRLSNNDFYSWLAPSLALRTIRIDALNDLKAVKDYDSIPLLVKAVAAGDCDAAGLPTSALDDYADQIGDAKDKVTVISTTTVFPFAILMLPIEVPLGARLTLTDALVKIAGDNAGAVTMRALLGQSALKTAATDDFVDLTNFMKSTGLDFAQLGN
jgi:ABC-type phosphate/phosphonate transport system substrate-binding protein